MDELSLRHCTPCKAGQAPLSNAQSREYLKTIHASWHSEPETSAITRSFEFKDFYQTMAFANAVAWIANQQDHHPELALNWGQCRVSYRTHSIGGLSENDFICAARIDKLTDAIVHKQ